MTRWFGGSSRTWSPLSLKCLHTDGPPAPAGPIIGNIKSARPQIRFRSSDMLLRPARNCTRSLHTWDPYRTNSTSRTVYQVSARLQPEQSLSQDRHCKLLSTSTAAKAQNKSSWQPKRKDKPTLREVPRPPQAKPQVRPSTRSVTAAARESPRSKEDSSGLNSTIHQVLPDVLWPGDTQILRLPWGGYLSYARAGPQKEQGPVWLHLSGTPSGRLTTRLNLSPYAEGQGIRVICIDRPGYGHSTLQNARGMSDFMKDVEYLLDFLGIKQFKIFAVSGGGAYALAAAHHFPASRLIKTGIMCGATHPDFEQTLMQIRWKF
jgi:hypothetical protein